MANILITAPSLNENINISGISSLTKTIIGNAVGQNYFHFTIGRKDAEGRGIKWILNQVLLMPHFVAFTIKNKIDIIHLNTDLTPASVVRDFVISTIARRLLKKRILMHIHGGYLLISPPKRSSFLYRLIKAMLGNATIRVVLSELENIKIHNTYGVPCSIMPNAVESAAKVEHKEFSGRLSLLFMGRIVRSKGVFLLASCLADLTSYFSGIDLKIYGAGPDLAEFQLQLSRIPGLSYKYCGVVKGTAKVKALNEAHVFLLPSLYGEGLPIALLESMNYGCVPVVSDDASMSTVVSDGCNGYLVAKGNANQLKEKLISVFDNRDKLVELSVNARQTIQTSYNLKNYMSNLNRLYALQ